jgi:lipoprotein-anchoring transpeptidase ErfK/SrfK
MPGLTSVAIVCVTALTAMAGVLPPLAGAGGPPVIKPSQELAMLVGAHVAGSLPGRLSGGRSVAASRPITGEQTALPIVGREVTRDGAVWLRVMLPGRPNETQGWIEQRGTQRAATSWRMVVRTTSRRLLVYHHGRLVRSISVSVGKPSTPTPHGQFFVEERVRMPVGSAGGPFALALNAHSDVLRTYDGGSGQIAIHGIANLKGAIGTASSHGCVRLADRDIRWLAARIAPGVLVRVAA